MIKPLVFLSKRERRIRNMEVPQPSTLGGYNRHLPIRERLRRERLDAIVSAKQLFETPALQRTKPPCA